MIECSCRGSIEHTDSFSSKFSPRVNNVSAKICVTPFISYKHIVISMIHSKSLWVGNLIDATATFAQIWRYRCHSDPSKAAGLMNVTGYGALPVKLWFCNTPLASKVSQFFKVLIVYWFAKWQKKQIIQSCALQVLHVISMINNVSKVMSIFMRCAVITGRYNCIII